MICLSRVRYIVRRQSGHVTLRAVVRRRCLLTNRIGFSTTFSLMALQAGLPELSCTLGRVRHAVWIVTRDTSQCSPAFDIAATRLHLLDVTDGFCGLILLHVRPFDENRPNIRNRISWPKIVWLTPRPQNLESSLKVTLVAYVITFDRFKFCRVHDRISDIIERLPAVVKLNVRLSGAVAALTANSQFSHDRLFVSWKLGSPTLYG